MQTRQRSRKLPAAMLAVSLATLPLLQETSWSQQAQSSQSAPTQQQDDSQNSSQPQAPVGAAQGSDVNSAPSTGNQSLPDSPGSLTSQPGTAQPVAVPPSPPSPKPQSQPVAPAEKSQPVGTAAAEGISPTGTAASEPAGVAVAPAKQHQKRNLLIALGAVAGGAIALGTVAALSKGSPSNPPGAH